MLHIPAQLTDQFTTYIGQQGIPAGQHRYYLKWMRYYLDFSQKYHFEQGTDMSLSAFLKKLNEKKQPAQLQKQAKHSVQLFLACAQFSKKQRNFKDKENAPCFTKILPNTYRNNRQEY